MAWDGPNAARRACQAWGEHRHGRRAGQPTMPERIGQRRNQNRDGTRDSHAPSHGAPACERTPPRGDADYFASCTSIASRRRCATPDSPPRRRREALPSSRPGALRTSGEGGESDRAGLHPGSRHPDAHCRAVRIVVRRQRRRRVPDVRLRPGRHPQTGQGRPLADPDRLPLLHPPPLRPRRGLPVLPACAAGTRRPARRTSCRCSGRRRPPSSPAGSWTRRSARSPTTGSPGSTPRPARRSTSIVAACCPGCPPPSAPTTSAQAWCTRATAGR